MRNILAQNFGIMVFCVIGAFMFWYNGNNWSDFIPSIILTWIFVSMIEYAFG